MKPKVAAFYGSKVVTMSDLLPKDSNIYVQPQETWTKSECQKYAKLREFNPYGTLHPWYGKISDSSSMYPSYGYTVNIGTSVDGVYYRSQHKPLPCIPDTYEFIQRFTWGIYIQKKK